jgi:DNA (cytosine-5)-methyltransferase 1
LIVDLFAGPGGWDEGARLAGYAGPLVGVEWDDDACHTAVAAGHGRICGDVSGLDTAMFAGLADGLIASPPCQAWSMAGTRKGELDREHVYARTTAFASGREPDDVDWADQRSLLTAEPMRWAMALRPRWIACEQVPAVLALWQYMAELLRGHGYTAWAGILSAEEYGVPQTRRRAILVARRDGGAVGPPIPTHQAYKAGKPHVTSPDLFGGQLPPPVSMADALGWGLPTRPAWTVTAGGTDTGGAEVFGNARNRAELREVVLRNGPQLNAAQRSADAPSGTIYCSRPGNLKWSLRNGNQANACTRSVEEPAGTLFFGQRTNAVQWVYDQPVDTESVRVGVKEAAVLQSFPAGYPWHGTKSAQFRQIGDAVPPRLAAAILQPLIAVDLQEAA